MQLFNRNMTVFLIGLFVLTVAIPMLQGQLLPGYAVQLAGKYLCFHAVACAHRQRRRGNVDADKVVAIGQNLQA